MKEIFSLMLLSFLIHHLTLWQRNPERGRVERAAAWGRKKKIDRAVDDVECPVQCGV